nr:LysR family transcriptional regulator [Corynebacterium sp. UBA5992]
MQDLDLAALPALTLVGQEHSISAASASLGLSQQAVSLRIRRIEKEMGVRLLQRSARGSLPTAAGELVIGWARPVIAAAESFHASAVNLRNDSGSKVRVEAILTIAEHLMPQWIAQWREKVRGAGPVIQLKAENSSKVIEVVVARKHPWAQKRGVALQELARTPLVLRELGSGTREAFEHALADAGYPRSAEPAAVLETTLGVRSAIISGLAPGPLSSLAVAQDIEAGRLCRVQVTGLSIQRPLTVIWAGKRLPRHVRPLFEGSLPRV